MPEEKRKINAWIPVSLYNKLETAGYENITQALIIAIESFGEDPQEDTKGYIEDIEGYKQDIKGYIQDITGYKQDIAALTTENDKLKEDISGYHRIQEGYKEDLSRIQKDIEKQNQDIIGYTKDIKALNNEIERLKEDLLKAPDIVEFVQLQARYEGIQEIVREKDKRIESLENDLKKADLREEDLKNMHNNYMLQVQSLINAKALSMPSGSRTTKEENRKKQEETGSNQEEIKVTPEKHNPWEGKEATIEKLCKYCNQPFLARNPKQEYCKPAHRTAYGRIKQIS